MLGSVRSLLFVPGDEPRKLAKALGSDADAVVVDLEDAVAPRAKATAREHAVAALTAHGVRAHRGAAVDGTARGVRAHRGAAVDGTAHGVRAHRGAAVDGTAHGDPAVGGPALMVRVNASGRELALDLDAIVGLDLAAVVLPKATPASVAALGSDGPPVIAIVETAIGLARAQEIAAAERVVALVLGSADLSAELGLEPLDGGAELLFARSKLVVDSACANIRSPFDGAYLRLDDQAGLAREATAARALGMRGKICIHPAQVATVNEVFGARLPVEWALATISAYESADGRGAVAHDGEMVDLAVVERARRVLRDAQAVP
jgi:citrate lyase beta subunit